MDKRKIPRLEIVGDPPRSKQYTRVKSELHWWYDLSRDAQYHMHARIDPDKCQMTKKGRKRIIRSTLGAERRFQTALRMIPIMKELTEAERAELLNWTSGLAVNVKRLADDVRHHFM